MLTHNTYLPEGQIRLHVTTTRDYKTLVKCHNCISFYFYGSNYKYNYVSTKQVNEGQVTKPWKELFVFDIDLHKDFMVTHVSGNLR